MGREIEVVLGEWKLARPPYVLYSGELGPCIAVAVYDPQRRIGYMMHDPSPDLTVLTSRFFEKVRDEKQNFSKLRAFAAGGDAYFPGRNSQIKRDFVEDVFRSRRFVEENLRSFIKPPNLEISWSPYDHEAELYLDTRTGEFTHVLTDSAAL